MVAICLQKVGPGQHKAGKVIINELEGHFVTNEVNWEEVSNMTGYLKMHLRESNCLIRKNGQRSANLRNLSKNCQTISG